MRIMDHLMSRARFTNEFLPAIQIRWKLKPSCNSVAGHQIATNFCTCHDSTAVVPCTKFCSDHCIRIEMRVKRNFHRIWIAMEKPLVSLDGAPACLGIPGLICQVKTIKSSTNVELNMIFDISSGFYEESKNVLLPIFYAFSQTTV